MGLTDNWQMAKILTDNWQIAENLTDYWHLPWVLLTTDKGPDYPLFSTKPVFMALNSIIVYCFVCHKLYKAKKSNYLNSHSEEAQENPPGL